MIYGLYEAYSIKDIRVDIDTTAIQVLCLGNSITHHAPKKGDLPGADSLWRGDWGMCASRPELDFVHLLESKFRRINKNTTVSRKNIWEWEFNLDINKDSLLNDYCQGKDLIIIKIGENVNKDNESHYMDAFDDLVSFCLRYTPNVIIAGSYWKAPRKENVMISAARKHNLPYVPLFWIFENHKEQVLAHVGDTIYDTRMQPYPIATEFICTHPNDEGMKIIADEIFKKIRIVNENNTDQY